MPHSSGTPCNINVIYIPLKSTIHGLQLCHWHYGSIFIRLAAVGSQSRKITRNSAKIWPYSSSRPSKVIDLGFNRKPICDFLLVTTVTLDVSPTIFQILTLKARQGSPAIADKPVRRESQPTLLQFDVLTTLSLTILAYLHAFNCCCVRNPRNPEKFT